MVPMQCPNPLGLSNFTGFSEHLLLSFAEGVALMDECEALAKAILEHVIPGSTMVFHVEQAHGNYDFDLFYPDGKVAAVEVTAAKDEDYERTVAAILDERKGGAFVPRQQCRNDWIIFPNKGARINRIREHIASYLARLEAEGIGNFSAQLDFFESPAVRRLVEDLQIDAGRITKWKTPSIGILPPGQGTVLDAREVDAAVLREAQKEDNRRKLREIQHLEKHLFVCIDPCFYGPYYAISNRGPSGLPVPLPAEIDIAWAVAKTSTACVVWRAERGHPWEILEPLKDV